MKIGELLVDKGLITPQQLAWALDESRKTGEVIGKVLVRLGVITQAQLLEVLADQLGLTFYPGLNDMSVSEQVLKAVPVKFVAHYKFMPLDLKGSVLTIAVSDPMAVWPMEDLKLHLGFDVERVLAPEKEILEAIRRYYGVGADTVDEILSRDKSVVQEHKDQKEEIEDVDKGAQDSSVIKLVNQILTEAVNARATDIHLEKFRDNVRLRYRIDGVLYTMRVPDELKYLYRAVISRIKIISRLNVVEKRLPQDGRAIIKIQDKQVDLRISVIPSIYEENIVIRILPVHLLFNLDDLGLRPEDLRHLEELMMRPHGIIFLTGPTGSGKTTTLYACLSKLNKDGVKIITIEDPVEYELSGIMQIQIRPEVGFTFANALRSILRHDPDIMMVGEVRDLETAELAIRTSLTGHLMFSTLHTNDAPSGATRLLDIGIEPYLVASSVNVFISQRLVRVICPSCRTVSPDKDIFPGLNPDTPVYYGKGCQNCNFIGYKGRTAIYEMMVVTEDIKELIVNKAPAAQIRKKAVSNGFQTLYEAGLEKIRQGVTTPAEVLRVTSLET